MEKIEFKDSFELFNRVKPALNSRLKELNREGIDTIKKEDIWNYLIKTKWINANNLVLSDVVTDILSIETKELQEYLDEKMRKRRVALAKDKIEII